MVDTKVEVKALLFPLLYTVYHTCIMFQQVKICLSDLLHLEHTHLNKLTTSTTVHHYWTFEEDDNSSLDNNSLHAGTEHHSPAEHPMACHLTSSDKEEENEGRRWWWRTLPNSSTEWWCLDGRTNSRQVCMHSWTIHNTILCPYPWPYSLDPLHLTPDYAPQYMNLSNIFDFPDVITTGWWGHS